MLAKKVKEIMIDIFNYPHIPYWFTLEEAIKILKIFITQHENFNPFIILVFDERYNLIGVVGLEEILRGLELSLTKDLGKVTEETVKTIFTEKIKDLVSRQIQEFMVPIKEFIYSEDTVEKAVYLFIYHKPQVLAVLKDQKLVGIVRPQEIINLIANELNKDLK